MKVSHSWLKKFVDFRLTPADLAERLNMVGLEVEGYEDQAKKYDSFVVGEVLERANHPNADRLSLCTVNIGKEVRKIVCGAPNVAAGQKVAVALVGAVIPHDQHDPGGKPFVLERATIRGVESDGMICSAFELGVGDDKNGIVVLDPKVKPGTPLARVLGCTDVIYEIGVTPNRSDCLSHIGVAREIAALVDKKLKQPVVKVGESAASAAKLASVRIEDPEKCPRYCARIVRNVRPGPSPKWLQDLLTAVGVRPVNNIVDVTNYVLMETGHPLHAFDFDKLAGHAIVVRSAREGETFITLDGKERTLTADMLMICDAERPVALAGVMGGANTEISDSTTSVLLESAYFEASNIRRTSKALGLSTEASYRFERGADIGMPVHALNLAAQMIRELAGGEVLKGVIDVYPRKRKPVVVKARVSRINSIIGTSLSKTEVAALLRKIGLNVRSGARDLLVVGIPSFRTDLVEEIDVVEEVARIHGYNRIETKMRASIDFSVIVRTDRLQDALKDHLIGSGFHEILTLSLQQDSLARLGGHQSVQVVNPVSAEMTSLRTSLVPGALEIVRSNRNHGCRDLRMFELGNVFSRQSGADPETLAAYHEEERVLLLLTGSYAPMGVGVVARPVDLLDLKGELVPLLTKFNLDKYRLIQYDTPGALTEPTVGVEINGTYAGFFGKIRSEIAAAFDVQDDVFVCELKTEILGQNWARGRRFAPLPKYPSVMRDLAFTVDATLPQGRVEEAIRTGGYPLLSDVTLFDVYSGQQAGVGKKSLAYALEFRAPDHTLTELEVDDVMRRIIDNVRRDCGGVLRG